LAPFSMLLRPDFKRIGDLAAGTLVVHAQSTRPARRDSRGGCARAGSCAVDA